ncbi:hypothetical protein N781_05695 [Pontibacillus halophilus JSM 076056 = DSM 19796]|uniref:Uncharacterized protein n=1 Tax=Pontibacillus halophilus JSM 076056 = DSM 19796 TaxID=1385510 RepID=A0A0A5GIB1_9BACI|nr:hypothetical protein [Pontibacillus halophilus]KGX90865.1 hypothetical protein N781_05695 [Pontibacillus halophilus JSM 076056 = DSM 19796]
MKKGVWMLLFLCSVSGVFLIMFTYDWQREDSAVVKYFPLDDSKGFQSVETKLSLLQESDEDEYEILWETRSELEDPVYLRQDVTLLYVDGRLKGLLSKWKENGQNIFQETTIHGEDSSHFQAITFHHGELHYPDDVIKSIQQMSSAELYVIDSPHTPLESFQDPDDSNQKEWKGTLDHATNQQLQYSWAQLLQHYGIDRNLYEEVPLTQLNNYMTKPFPNLTIEQTQQVLGQLWEGLYRNYVLNVNDNNENLSLKSLVPLILLDKKGTHLIVVYEDAKGNKQRLLQRYPTYSND